MTSKLNLFLAFSLFGFCLGLPECTPANQCTDLWTAKKCNAVKHCIEEDWSKLKPTGMTDDVCSICLRMVGEARDVLQSNSTREELKKVLEGSCSLMVLKPAVEICNKFVDELGDELIAVLASQMDPEAVCSVARLCNNAALREAQKNSKECVHCDAFFQMANNSTAAITTEEFKSGILDLCRTAGTFTDACSHLGLVHAESLFETTLRILKRKPCEASLLCPANSKTSLSDFVTKAQMCPLCKMVMKSLRERLLRVKNAEEFAGKVTYICDRLDVSNSTCSLLSGRGFYDKLKTSEKLPDLICYVTYCAEKPTENVPVWPLVGTYDESIKLLNVLEMIDNLETFFMHTMKKDEANLPIKRKIDYGDPIENPVFLSPVLITPRVPGTNDSNHAEDCKTCNELVRFASEPAENDEDHLKMFQAVCENVVNVANCKRFTDEFSLVFAEAFSRKIPLKEICPRLVPKCQVPNKSATEDSSPTHSDVTTVKKVPCKFCLMAIRMVLDQLENNKTEESIRKILDGLCKYFPEETRDTCRNLIDEYTEDIIDMIIADFNETEICTYLKLCPNWMLLQKKTGNESLPATFNVHTNEVQDWIDHEREATLAAYTKSKKNERATAGKPSEEVLLQFHEVVQECALCEALVGVISSHKKMLDKDYDFVKNSNHICSIVPKNRRKKCTSMIISYGPSIVHLLQNEKVDPNEVCVRLDLCDPKMQAKVNQPVSAAEPEIGEKEEEPNKCLLGPGFWCANAENAEKCGTFLHCQEMVWKNWKSPPKRPSKL